MENSGTREAADRPNGGPAGPSPPPDGPLLAVDWGEKRIGLAISDAAQTVAHPLATLERRAGKRFPMQQLRVHLADRTPVAVVMGLPLESEGGEGPAARAARASGDLIASKTGLPVYYQDERMTSARVLSAVRDLGGRTRGRKGDVDQLAAVVILQTFLERLRP